MNVHAHKRTARLLLAAVGGAALGLWPIDVPMQVCVGLGSMGDHWALIEYIAWLLLPAVAGCIIAYVRLSLAREERRGKQRSRLLTCLMGFPGTRGQLRHAGMCGLASGVTCLVSAGLARHYVHSFGAAFVSTGIGLLLGVLLSSRFRSGDSRASGE